MISAKNLPLFKVEKDPIKIADAKHQFYFNLNRMLERRDPSAKFIAIGFRLESVLHLVHKELQEAGYNCVLFVDPIDDLLKIRLLLKD